MPRFHPIVSGIVWTSLLLAAPPARADIVEDTFVAIDQTVEDQCTGEDVALTGGLHMHISMTFTGNTLHVHSHGTFSDMDGVGLSSGDQYTATGASNSELNGNAEGEEEETFVASTNLISAGAALNQRLDTRYHITITPDGDVTVTIVDMSLTCEGAAKEVTT
jgi:hypothetical protein